MAHQHSNISTTDYEPFLVNDKQAGEVHWLRTEGSDGSPQYAGFWRCGPMTFDYVFPGDEIFQGLEGELHIKTKDGKEVVVKKGDIVAFDKGVESVWTIPEGFTKFFVIT